MFLIRKGLFISVLSQQLEERPLKRPKSKPEVLIWRPQKLERYQKAKKGYSFWVRMAGLVDMLVEEMVKRREAEERTAAALERLLKWIEEMDLESEVREDKDTEGLEVSVRATLSTVEITQSHRLAEGKTKEKSLRSPTASKPVLYYV